MAKKAIKILGPAICDAFHVLTPEELQTRFKINVIDSRIGVELICRADWERLKTEFQLPTKTLYGVDLHGLLSHVLEVHREMIHRATMHREFAKVPLRAKRGQLGAIARPLKLPRPMPRPLFPEVESLLAGRIALFRNRTGDLFRSIDTLRAEVRNSELVTTELWLAANEVRLMGAFSRERISVGGPNADTASQLLISHLLNIWRFDLGLELKLTCYDSKKRATITYSDIVSFVHRFFLLSDRSDLSIDAVYRRVENVMLKLYSQEFCNHGCGFNLMHRYLPTADVLKAISIDSKISSELKISVPKVCLSRSK